MKHNVHTNTTLKSPNMRALRRRRIKKQLKVCLFFLLTCLLVTYFTTLARVEAHTQYTLSGVVNPCELLAAPISELEETTDDTAADTADDFSASDDDADDTAASYDYSKPVPVCDMVGDDYFDDAVFIGDSRTEGMILNTGLWNTTAYVYKGLMVNTVFTKPVVNINGEKIPVMDALKSTNFSKVYIMLGINETGWAYSPVFQEKYKDIIDAVQEINPDAFIYIQGIIPVSDKVSSEHPYITNSKIAEYNRLLQELAEEKEVYFIDTKNAVMSTNGALPEDAATDGIHLVNEYCQKWLDYLKTHTVNE